MSVRTTILLNALLLFSFNSYAQTQKDLAKFTAEPRHIVSLPEDYCTTAPGTSFIEWLRETNVQRKHLPADVAAVQKAAPFSGGKEIIVVYKPTALPHITLDSNTLVRHNRDLYGYWRAITIRTVTYKDSCSLADSSIHCSTNTLSESKTDDIIAVFTEDIMKLFLKEADKKKFQVLVDGKYEIVNKRYLLQYKALKSGANISLIGIDKEGRLIINAYSMIERRAQKEYITYETTMQQLVFEKLRVGQLHYDKEKKDFQGPKHGSF